MNTVALQNRPEPLTVVCGYDPGDQQFTIYGVYGPEVSEETLRQQYTRISHVQFVRQFKNMYLPHVVFTAQRGVKKTA